MKVIALKGGLGNQLFQIAYALLMQGDGKRVMLDSRLLSKPWKLDNSRSLSVDPQEFGLRLSPLGSIVGASTTRFLKPLARVFRDPWDWAPPSDTVRQIYLEGFFQDQDLVSEVSREIFPPLVVRRETAPVEEEFVAVHVRLGDYMNPATADFHGLTDPSWSIEQGNTLADFLGVRRVVVFTDSREVLSKMLPRGLLEGFEIDQTDNAIDVLVRMAGAQGIVMSNSTLSWWSARLAEAVRPGQVPVIFPIPWFKNHGPMDSKLCLQAWRPQPRRLILNA